MNYVFLLKVIVKELIDCLGTKIPSFNVVGTVLLMHLLRVCIKSKLNKRKPKYSSSHLFSESYIDDSMCCIFRGPCISMKPVLI